MTKKVLILSSSPRRGGNSDTLCNEFMRGAIESGNEAEKFSCVTRQSIIARDAAHVACTKNLARRKTMQQKL